MIQAKANIPNMAPPTIRRMIRVADLEAGGYGSLEGTKVVVCIVVIVVASDILFLFFLEGGRGGEGEGCLRGSTERSAG